MEQDLFYLPSEIMLNILSRLHFVTIMRCKCVCKPWLELLETREFVNYHLSESFPGSLMLFECRGQPKPFKIVKYEFDLNSNERRWNTVFSFNLPPHNRVHTSATGLLLCTRGGVRGALIVCNPITRDYIKLPSTPIICAFEKQASGFGVSKMSCQYKVVRIFQFEGFGFKGQVYTVGTGSWRRIASDGPLDYFESSLGAFLNGNLHWLARKGFSITWLDLETETFSTFSPPPFVYPYKYRILCVLKECLCVCDSFNNEEVYAEIAIWSMTEYGDDNSWTKQLVIRPDCLRFLGELRPVVAFEDGDILMKLGRIKMLYSSKTGTVREVSMFGLEDGALISSATTYSPSVLPLRSLAMLENVCSF